MQSGKASDRGGAPSHSARRLRLVAAMLLASSIAGCGYNRLQELDERARGARSEIEVQLQRRVDVVPNLVETLRGYASLDDEVVTEVADARARLARVVRSGELGSMEEGNAELAGAVNRLMEFVVEYPALRADPGFRLLRSQLEEIEESIVAAGRDYNEAVQQYNAYIKGFPQVMTAKLIGAEELRSFEIRDAPSIVKAAGE